VFTRRVAQTFYLVGITNTVGAPSFAPFVKGGSRDCLRESGLTMPRASITNQVAQAASPPTLAKSARMGHPLWEWMQATIS
jgi:hypothetical protein